MTGRDYADGERWVQIGERMKAEATENEQTRNLLRAAIVALEELRTCGVWLTKETLCPYIDSTENQSVTDFYTQVLHHAGAMGLARYIAALPCPRCGSSTSSCDEHAT
jgi:hypothetical protein